MKLREVGQLVRMGGALMLACVSSPGKEDPGKEPPPPAFDKPALRVLGVTTNGHFGFELEPNADAVFSIQSSTALSNWTDAAVLIGTTLATNTSIPYFDARPADTARFYRVQASEKTPTNDWKNGVFYPIDPFLSEPSGFGGAETRWVKFAIATNQPQRVIYQDTAKFKFHYDFATARLPQFQGLSPEQFDQVTLYTNAQQAVLGTVLFPPDPALLEVGVQLVGFDPYSVEQISAWFEAVRTTVAGPAGLKFLYIPTYEQSAFAEANRAQLAARGIDVATAARWETAGSVYASGWAIGTLKYFPTGQIVAAYADGRLQPEDILLTDAVPAELPYLAGILTLQPSTPNSHVAILAASYGVPFAWLYTEELRAQAQALAGRPVVVTATRYFSNSRLEIVDVGAVSESMRQEIADLKVPPPIDISPKAHFGSYIAPTEELNPADIRYFGGKAANFGFLRREIPTNSPPGIGISFDLWDEFIAQTMPGGKTLGQEISERLGKFSYPPNVGALSADLEAIRDMIEDDTLFTQAQQDAIAAALLGRFDPNKKIRFRSSTNVEDGETFTGAGLYDSYSGCLADDIDENTSGPSICDAAEDKERGVFRAIRKVYASFYNLNAVLERMRHRVNEADVGMAVLVHYSNPDPEEMANGVATVQFQKDESGHSIVAKMVTQKGAESVTNPDGSATPEVARVQRFSGSTFSSLEQWSSLVPRGAYLLEWEGEYRGFVDLFSKIAAGFERYYPNKSQYTLDFEYKKIVPGSLLVKQVRELPGQEPPAPVAPYLVNDPKEWCVFQGEFSNVFANHRLKSRLFLNVRDVRLVETNFATTFYTTGMVSYVEGTEIKTLSGSFAEFPGAQHAFEKSEFGTPRVIDSWTDPESPVFERITLATGLREPLPGDAPVVRLEDLGLELHATYETPQPGISDWGEPALVTNEVVMLTPCERSRAGEIAVTRTVTTTNDFTATISFFHPAAPTGVVAGYTAPLLRWNETTLTGLTEQPVVLRDYYSQTYRPGHHNFGEEFLFEPRLEPGISPALLAELEAKDIRLIYVFWGGAEFDYRVAVIGADGKLRYIAGEPQPGRPGVILQ